jgi:Na+/proline symporter
MGFTNAPLLGRIAEIAIVAFAVVIAINQIGIAADLVNIIFIGLVGAFALAFGLAFGLGGRDVAAQLTQSWYESTQAAARKVAAADSTPSRPVAEPPRSAR